MKIRLPLLAGVLLVACASPKVGHDVYPDAPIPLYRSFRILEATAREAPEDPRFGPLLDRHTEDAIAAALRSRGYVLRSESEGEVDFLVSYANEVRYEREYRSSPITIGLGYGTYLGSGVGIGTSLVGPTDGTARNLVKGTLVIDVRAASSGRVVWRGWAEDTLSPGGDPRAEIFEAASRIFARFPAAAPR